MNQQIAANTLAITKAVETKVASAVRSALSSGNHDVDVTVRIHGQLRIGADYEVTPTVSFSLLETLALFAHYSGITREAAKHILYRTLHDAIDAKGKGAGALTEALPWMKAEVEAIQAEIAATMPKQPRRGPVNAALEYEFVGTPTLVPQPA